MLGESENMESLSRLIGRKSTSLPGASFGRSGTQIALRPCQFAFRLQNRSAGVPSVAVGTAIAGRPPHRSVRARLRIRLLPRMNGVEALIGIGMQDTRVRNPPVEQWVETIPAHLRALSATD